MILVMFADNMSQVMTVPVFRVFNQVRHKPGCTATENGLRLEFSNIGDYRGIVLAIFCSEKKSYSAADLGIRFGIC